MKILTFLFITRLAVLSSATNIVTPIEKSSGMLFQPDGTVANKVDEWNILTSFDTNIIWHKIKQLCVLKHHLQHAMQYHNYSGYSEQETKKLHIFLGEDILWLETRLRNLESSADNYRSRPKRSIRQKRAIWRGGSELLEFFYGTPSASDADYYSKKFNKLSTNQKIQEELNKKNFKIMNNLFDIVEKTRLQVDANLHAVNESLFLIEEEVRDIQENLASIRVHLGITNLLVQFNTFSEIICTEIDLLQNAVLFAKRDVLHPSVVNSNHQEVLSSITLPPNRRWISDIHNAEINVILSHCM